MVGLAKLVIRRFIGVAGHVDHDGAGENQDVVFSGRDVDSVGVHPAEPSFGDSRHDGTAA